jgi:acyl-CoA dehydrogenase
MEAARDTDQARGVINFDAALWAHIGHVISNKARSFVLGLTNGRLAGAPAEGIVRRYYQRLSRYSANLALMADVCMAVLGGSLKFRESISARLGDVLAKLYIASATLKRFEEDGRPGADLPLLSWLMEASMLNIEQQLDGVLRNLPSRPVAWLLRLVIFPTGLRARPPSDRVNTAIAEILQTPCASRDRLARTVNVPEGTSQPLGLLNVAMQKIIASKGVEKRVLEAFKAGRIKSDHPAERVEQALAAGVVNADEARQLREAFQLLHDVISVDDFDHSELARTATAPKASARETAAA